MFVGLDLSLRSTGYCRMWDSTIFETGTLNFPDLSGAERLAELLCALEGQLLIGEPIELVAIEGYALGMHGSSGRIFDLAEWGGLVKWWLFTHNIPYMIVTPTSLKLFVTGSGSSDKVAMGQALLNRHGVDFIKDWARRNNPKNPAPRPDGWGNADSHWRNDEADAYSLANLAALYSGLWDLSPSVEQLRVIESIKTDPHGTIRSDNHERKQQKKNAN